MTEFELFQALRPHYPSREYALLPQVANGTGGNANRHCDALALSLWPSRGLRLHGFEIKSHRSDWTRELKNPEKAEEIAQYCNHWWIVSAYAGMVPIEQLPPGWGLMEYAPNESALKKTVNAPYREATQPDLPFIAAMLRKAQEVVTPDAVIAAEREKAHAEGVKQGKSLARSDAAAYQDLKQRVADFEKASGIKITGWEKADKIGAAVHQVLNGTVMRGREALRRIAENLLEELK